LPGNLRSRSGDGSFTAVTGDLFFFFESPFLVEVSNFSVVRVLIIGVMRSNGWEICDGDAWATFLAEDAFDETLELELTSSGCFFVKFLKARLPILSVFNFLPVSVF